MLQLKACLLLLVVTTESLLALPYNTCNGHMNLSQEPAGHLDLSLGKEGAHRPSSGLMVCTRTLELPAGQTVRLTVVLLESGSNMSLICTGDRGERTLAVGDTVVLSGCDQDRASLTWTGAGHSSNAFQLFYYVQKEESSSTEANLIPQSHPNVDPPDPTTIIEESPLTEQFLDPSRNSTRNAELIQPTTPPLASASTDREAPLFPGEESNNGPDASGAPQHTDIPGSLDFFSTQRSTSTRSEFYTSQNAELQSFPVSDVSEDTTSTIVYDATESSTNIQTAGYEEKKIVVSSIPALLETSSTVLSQNESRTVDKTNPDSTENWESSSTQITNSPRLQNTERIEESSIHGDFFPSTSSLVTLGGQLSTVGSTEMPLVATESEATHTEIQSVVTQDSAQTMSASFDLSETSKYSTQESTQNALGRQSSPTGTSSSSLVPYLYTIPPYVTETDLSTFPTSPSPSLASTDSKFEEHSTEEGKTSSHGMDLLTTSSYLVDHTTSSEVTSLPTQPMSTLSSRESYTVHSSGRFAELLSTVSPNTISEQQTFKMTTIKSDIFPKTGPLRTTTSRSQTVSTSTLLQVSHIPYQAQSSKYKALPTTTITGQKGATTVITSQRMTSWTPEHVNHVTTPTQTYLSASPSESSTVQHKPKYYIVPDEPVIIKVESIELLLQIVVEESTSAWTTGLEEDVAFWLEPYIQKAPGFKELRGVWTSGHVVQCLVQFDTRGALQWLPHTGASLLERTGLKQAVRAGQAFRAATITNITLGGVQEACGWLLQCPSGFVCVFDSRSSSYSCTSVCHSDYCLHHGLCTHHPAQLPVCRCVAGQDFWYMGPRCEVRMTRARLVLTCLGVLLVVVGVVGVLACMAVRRYRALLIQAKVDQTRSRFNHFDELSGRFWLRSMAGSADSLDNPVFTHSDEILQLRALERPCCYHDDSLSLPSTCPSPGTHIRTIYPHSSQYAWRGSELSVGDGVLDSGKASDLSVCSWPREPIQWSPFPLLQQLALQRPPAVRVPRTRSYCDGMELVDMNKSWTA